MHTTAVPTLARTSEGGPRAGRREDLARSARDDIRRGDPVSDPGVEGGVDEPNEDPEDDEDPEEPQAR